MLKAHPVFFPGRLESVGTVVSIGGPKGAALVAAGVAGLAAQPPELDDDTIAAHMIDKPAHVIHEPAQLSAEACVLVAALSRRVRRRRRH